MVTPLTTWQGHLSREGHLPIRHLRMNACFSESGQYMVSTQQAAEGVSDQDGETEVVTDTIHSP